VAEVNLLRGFALQAFPRARQFRPHRKPVSAKGRPESLRYHAMTRAVALGRIQNTASQRPAVAQQSL
jgi:hypothetical protein